MLCDLGLLEHEALDLLHHLAACARCVAPGGSCTLTMR